MNNNIGKNMMIIVMSGFIIRLIFKLAEKGIIIQVTIVIVSCAMLAYYMTHGVNKKG